MRKLLKNLITLLVLGGIGSGIVYAGYSKCCWKDDYISCSIDAGDLVDITLCGSWNMGMDVEDTDQADEDQTDPNGNFSGHIYPAGPGTYSFEDVDGIGDASFEWWATSGSWPYGTVGRNKTWAAPNCVDTVTFAIIVDDGGDDSVTCWDANCPGNDDYPNYDDGDRDVVLPSGCSNGTASIDIDFEDHIVADPGEHPGCSSGDCGAFAQIYTGPWDVDLVYHDCQWEIKIDAHRDMLRGRCSFNEVSTSDLSEVTEDNYCDIVHSMYTGSGCAESGGEVYSTGACVDLHEASHKDQAVTILALEAEDLEDDPIFTQVFPIDCDDESSQDCHTALGGEDETYIDYMIDCAFSNADSGQSEVQARMAAQSCFNSVKTAICNHAFSESWEYCSDCY